jgi:DNA repair photolyase
LDGGLVAHRVHGRGSRSNPANRFEGIRLDVLEDILDEIIEVTPDGRRVKTTVYPDRSRTVINPVDSPDLSFKWTINPYRGCEHGCVYCYARPTHEMLGLSCGLDFETKIAAKLDAPDLLRAELSAPRWRARRHESIVLSGVTDPYQPVEAKLGVTRKILEVMREMGQSVSLITKSRLILRDIDLLRELSQRAGVRCAVSVTTLDAKLSASMEPRASAPRERLRAIRELSAAGLPVAVMAAPIIPGLNDREIPRILEAASEAGATSAGYIMLRLPHQLKGLFLDWLAQERPDSAKRIEAGIRGMRGGRLYDSRPGVRQRGLGERAEQIAQLFRVYQRRYGLESPPAHSRLPATSQLSLFG